MKIQQWRNNAGLHMSSHPWQTAILSLLMGLGIAFSVMWFTYGRASHDLSSQLAAVQSEVKTLKEEAQKKVAKEDFDRAVQGRNDAVSERDRLKETLAEREASLRKVSQERNSLKSHLATVQGDARKDHSRQVTTAKVSNIKTEHRKAVSVVSRSLSKQEGTLWHVACTAYGKDRCHWWPAIAKKSGIPKDKVTSLASGTRVVIPSTKEARVYMLQCMVVQHHGAKPRMRA